MEKGDASLLVFDSDQVLARVAKQGDLFEPVLKLKQKLPPVGVLEGVDTNTPQQRSKAARPKRAGTITPGEARQPEKIRTSNRSR